jgi:hypothetical protein
MDLNALSESGKVFLLIVAVGLFAHAEVRRSWHQHRQFKARSRFYRLNR